jgi:hypothetical protein
MDYDFCPVDRGNFEDSCHGGLRTQENRSARTILKDLDAHRATTSRPSAGDQQFARFLEAADRLGEHLASDFESLFIKLAVAPPTAETSIEPRNTEAEALEKAPR